VRGRPGPRLAPAPCTEGWTGDAVRVDPYAERPGPWDAGAGVARVRTSGVAWPDAARLTAEAFED